MPMRVECKHYESRTYASGDSVRKCHLDLAPEAPWRCPDECPRYERRMADVAWSHGTVVPTRTPDPPEGQGIAELLDAAEDIVNSAAPEMLAEVRRERSRSTRAPGRGWRRWLPGGGRR